MTHITLEKGIVEKALETLTNAYWPTDSALLPAHNTKECAEAIASLRQAIAEAEKPEPVKLVAYNCVCGRQMRFESVNGVVALQREWVGLDIDDRAACYEKSGGNLSKFAAAIEAKLKEKNT